MSCNCLSDITNNANIRGKFGRVTVIGPDQKSHSYFYHEKEDRVIHLITVVAVPQHKVFEIVEDAHAKWDEFVFGDSEYQKLKTFVVKNNLLKSDIESKTLCKYFRINRVPCKHACNFSHDLKALENENERNNNLCRNVYKAEGCTNQECTFSHDATQFPCRFEEQYGNCNRDHCVSKHSKPKGAKQVLFCKNGGKCTTENCKFNHNCYFENKYGTCNRKDCDATHLKKQTEIYCKFGANCETEDCKFNHNCKTEALGRECLRRECLSNHSNFRLADLCTFGARCKNDYCKYSHDVKCDNELKYGNCKNVSKCKANHNFDLMCSSILNCNNRNCKYNHHRNEFLCPYEQDNTYCQATKCEFKHKNEFVKI